MIIVNVKDHTKLNIFNDKLIYEDDNIFVFSEEEPIEINSKFGKIIIFGKIYSIIDHEGKYQKIESKNYLNDYFNKIEISNITQLINNIEGDFVGCFIKDNSEVMVFGDSFNKKDIFYFISKNEIIISTDLSWITPNLKLTYDQVGLANLLSIYGSYTPKKQTIYNEIARLGVSESIIIKNGRMSIIKNEFKPLKTKTYDSNYLESYVALLTEAIKIRSSKKNWVYLSSGWDSTALLGLLVDQFGSSKIKAVTGSMRYSERAGIDNIFEIEKAKKIADFYSIETNIVPLDYTQNQSIKDYEKIKPYLKNNHIYSDNSLNYYLLSKFIKENGSSEDAVFCGEISDAVHNLGFAQYNTINNHPVQDFREYSDKLICYLFGPTFLNSIYNGNAENDIVYKIIKERHKKHMFDSIKDLNHEERTVKFISSFFLRNVRVPFYSLKNNKILTKLGATEYESKIVKEYFSTCIKELKPETVYSWILYLYNSFHWQGSSVKTISYMTNFNGFQVALPFWDKKLMEFFYQMPENWGRGLELKPAKYPLKWMLNNKIEYPIEIQKGPHSYQYDVNPNFSLEKELLCHSSLTPIFQNIMKKHPYLQILDKRYFNTKILQKITEKFINGLEINGYELNVLYNLVWFCYIGWY